MSLTSRQKNRLLYALLMAACILGFWWIENFYTSDPYASAEGADNAYDLPLAWVPDYPGGEPVRHDYYRLSYSEPYEQAAWVAYMLQPAKPGVQRRHLERTRSTGTPVVQAVGPALC